MKTLWFGMAAFVAFAPSVALAQTDARVQAQSSEATLSVAGDATVRREPDRARVDVEIVTNDDDAARSASKNAAVVRTLDAKLEPLGIASDAIGTTSFRIDDVPQPPKNLPPEQRQPRYGFITTRDLSIVVDRIERAGAVVDAATSAGVTQIDGVRFELRDRKALEREALVAALADAKATAEALAASGTFRIARIARIRADGATALAPVRPLSFSRNAVPAAAPIPTEIAPNGPIEVSAHVEVTYEIR